MANTATLSILIQAKDYASQALKTITKSVNTLETAVDKTNKKFNQFKQNFDDIARYVKYALGAITATGTAIVAFSKDTEKAMANASTMFGVTAKEFEKQLGNKITTIAQKYGFSLKSMWEATYALGSAGIELKDVPAVLEQVAKASVAGATDVETAFTGAIKQIKGFGLNMQDLTKVYAVQFQAVKYGLLNYEQLAQYIPEISASARSLGENWISATATFATLTKYMPDASQAANALQNAYDELTQKSEQLTKAGIKLYENGKFIGFVNVLKQLRNQLKGKTNEEVANFINQLQLSDTARQAIVNLINNFDDLENITNLVTDDVSALNEMFIKQTSTLEFQIRKLLVVLDNLKQTIYNAFKGVLGVWIEKAIRWFQGLAKWIDENKDKFVALITAVTKLLIAIVIFNMMLNVLSKLGSVVSALVNPFTWLFGILVAWFASLDKAKRIEVIQAIINGIGNAIKWLGKQFKLIQEQGFFKWLIGLLGGALKAVLNFAINATVTSFEWLAGKTVEGFMALIEFFAWLARTTISGFAAIIEFFNPIFKKVIEGFTAVIQFFNWIAKKMINGFTATIEFFVWIADKVIDGFLVVANFVEYAFEKSFEAVVYFLENLDKISAWILNGAITVTIDFLENLSKISSWILNNLIEIAAKITFTYIALYDWIVSGVRDLVVNVAFNIAEGAKKIWNFFSDLIVNAWKKTIQFTIDLIKGKNEFEETKPVNPEAPKEIGSNPYIITGETTTSLTGSAISTTTLATDKALSFGQYALRMGAIFGGIGAGVLTSSALSATFMEQALKYALLGAGFAEGGYTGNGGKYDVAGIVHKGEYVIPAWLVEKYPQLISILEQKRIKGYADGGSVATTISSFLGGDVLGEIGTNVKTVADIIPEIINYISNYIPEVKENQDLITETLNKMLGIQEGNDKTQKSMLQQLTEDLKLAQTLYPETKAYYDFEKGQAGFLTQIFKGGFDVLTGSIGNVGGIIGEGIAKTSFGQAVINGVKKTENWVANKASGFASGAGNVLGELGNQISGDAIFGPILNGLSNMFSGLFGMLGSLFGPIIQAVMSLSNVVALLNPINTIVESLMAVIGPLINGALQPFVNILKALGQMLGTLLVPILQPLFAGLQAFGAVLTWIYNAVLVPIGRGFYIVFGMIASAFNWLYNIVSDVIKGLTFGVVDIGKRTVKSMGQIIKEANEKIAKVDLNVEQNVENSYQSQYTSTVQRSAPEVVNQTIIVNANDSFIFDSESSFKEWLAKAAQELFDNGTLKFA
ncbi:phage tail tape measure protein [Marinitoga lauensis]|uniref:phage tail tape measure protein n=1 Tax=Marinitoga lauensis TaxID=2201189 RepID=UPI001010484F|nr:phage tail tape measure protein [Marinitoga lauensis]